MIVGIVAAVAGIVIVVVWQVNAQKTAREDEARRIADEAAKEEQKRRSDSPDAGSLDPSAPRRASDGETSHGEFPRDVPQER